MATSKRDLRLEDIHDDEERRKVNILIGTFPFTTVRAARDYLAACGGDIHDAGNILAQEDADHIDGQMNESASTSVSMTDKDNAHSPEVKREVEYSERNELFVTPPRTLATTSSSTPSMFDTPAIIESGTRSPSFRSGRISTRTTSSDQPDLFASTPSVPFSAIVKIEPSTRHAGLDGNHSHDKVTVRNTGGTTIDINSADTSDEFDIETIRDEDLRDKVQQLGDMIPQAGYRFCLDLLRRNDGSLAKAFADVDKAGMFEDVDKENGESSHRHPSEPQSESQESSMHRKRGAGVQNHRAAKRARADDDKEAAKLLPADLWVKKNLSNDAERVNIVLEGGARRNVPKQLLCESSEFFRECFDSLPQQAYVEQELGLNDVSPAAFDLLLQWLVCKAVTPSRVVSMIKSMEITHYLDFVLLAHKFSIAGPVLITEERLKMILVESRSALEGIHITKAYALPKGHPIRTLFLKAAVRPFIEYRDVQGEEYMDDSGDDSEDENRRIAFGSKKFWFGKERALIPEFKEELNDLKDRVLAQREFSYNGKGKNQQKISKFIDPLTGDRFTF